MSSYKLPGVRRILILAALVSLSQLQKATPQQPPANPNYDPAIFQKRLPANEIGFLSRLAGSPSGDALRDKEFRKLMHSVIPDCTFHYGVDMPMFDALEKVLKDSLVPVEIRDGRYVTISGRSGPYLAGRGFLWFDMQEGIGLGAFFFHPTNGEPTPTVTVFSRLVKADTIGVSRLPPEFAADLRRWWAQAHLHPVITTYFIAGAGKRLLLEHDEDFCVPVDGNTAPPSPACDQMNAEAADIDLTAAYYLEQVHYPSNATAWMIVDDDQVAWLRVRDTTCGNGPDPLRCRIRLTRERTRAILNRRPIARIARR